MKKKLMIFSTVLCILLTTGFANATTCFEQTVTTAGFRQIIWEYTSVNADGSFSFRCCAFFQGFMNFEVRDQSGFLLFFDSEIAFAPTPICNTLFFPGPSCCFCTNFGGSKFCTGS